MIISEWPAMIMVTAERVAPGDVIYGQRKNFKIELFDEPLTVTRVKPALFRKFAVRIDGHESDMVDANVIMDIHDHVLIKKGK